MTIRLNGTDHETSADTIAGLVAELGLAPETVLVEHNGNALLRSEWPAQLLAPDDRVEILRVAAGG